MSEDGITGGADLEGILLSIEERMDAAFPAQVGRDWLERTAGSTCDLDDPDQASRFIAPGRDLLKRGGKRWRPLVMVLTCRALGGGDSALDLTPLVELPHNGSLIIDDIEDGSEQRRGLPAVHLIHGVDLAINAGNLMYFQPTYLIEDAPFSPERKNLLFSGYLEDLRRLHLGQGLDILWHRNHDRVPSVKEYMQMCRFKTGSLSRMAGRLGALAAGKTKEDALESALIWEDIGVGFQIADDIINLTTGNPGKARGDDIVEGKKSLPVILQYHKSPETGPALARCFEEARELGHEEGFRPIEEAIGLMESSGALEEARAAGRDLLARSLDRLNRVLPPGPDRSALAGLVGEFL